MEARLESAYLSSMRPLLIVAALTAMTGSALAMNWEGHDDDWHKDLSFAKAFRDAVAAPPLIRPLPPCDSKIDNVYDQVRIEGKNCISSRKPPASGTQPSE